MTWTGLLMVTIFVACSDKDVLPTDTTETNTKDAIVFGGKLSDNRAMTTKTRAMDLEDFNNTFRVFGYKNTTYDANSETYAGLQTVFGGYEVIHHSGTAGTTESNRNDWEYANSTNQTLHYWDYAAKAYRFAAYSPFTATVTTEQTETNITFDFAVSTKTEADIAATPFYSKMWFSNNNYPTYTAYGSVVTISFVRPFCRVRFILQDEKGNIITTESELYKHLSKNTIKFKPADSNRFIVTGGRIRVSYPLIGTNKEETLSTIAGTSTDDKLEAMTDPYEDTPVLATTEKKWYTLFPIGAQGDYVMSLDYNGHTRTAVVPAKYTTWNVGYEYTFVFKISESKLTFLPDLYVYTKWQAGYSENTTW